MKFGGHRHSVHNNMYATKEKRGEIAHPRSPSVQSTGDEQAKTGRVYGEDRSPEVRDAGEEEPDWEDSAPGKSPPSAFPSLHGPEAHRPICHQPLGFTPQCCY